MATTSDKVIISLEDEDFTLAMLPAVSSPLPRPSPKSSGASPRAPSPAAESSSATARNPTLAALLSGGFMLRKSPVGQSSDSWCCTICTPEVWRQNSARGVAHFATHTAAKKAMDDALAANAAKRARVDDAGTSSSTKSGPMDRFVVDTDTPKERLAAMMACATAELMAPFTFAENLAATGLVEQIFQLGRDEAKKGYGGLKTLAGLYPSRKVVQSRVTVFAQKSKHDELTRIRKDGALRGVSVLEDSKTTQRTSFSAIGAAVGSGYYLLDLSVSGSKKKTATEIQRNIITALRKDDVYKYAFSSCFDGASPCTLAGKLLERDHYLLRVRCQTHAMALLIKWIFSKVPELARVVADAETIILHFFSVGTLISALREHNDGGTLLMFISTRFNFHWAALAQLLKRRTAVSQIVNDASATSPWVLAAKGGTLNSKKKATHRAVFKLVNDFSSWQYFEFAKDVARSITIALRLLDGSACCSGFVRAIWSILPETVCAAMSQDKYDFVPASVKSRVLELVVEAFSRECSPHFDAAFMCNPFFHSKLVALRASDDVQDEEEYKELLTSLRATLDLYVKRLNLISGASTTSNVTVESLVRDFMQYLSLTHVFANATPHDHLSSASPREWWEANEHRSKSLSRFAVMMLSMSSTTSSVERGHKLMTSIFTADRNRLAKERLVSLVQAVQAGRAEKSGYASLDFCMDDFLQISTLSDDQEASVAEFKRQVALSEEAAKMQKSFDALAGTQESPPDADTDVGAATSSDAASEGDASDTGLNCLDVDVDSAEPSPAEAEAAIEVRDAVATADATAEELAEYSSRGRRIIRGPNYLRVLAFLNAPDV